MVAVERVKKGSVEGEDSLEKLELGQPKIGEHVYARVLRVEDRFVKAEILAREDPRSGEMRILRTTFQGILFKENARSYDLETVELLKCFRPHDIIKAKVLTEQVGGKDSSTVLSTTDDSLGVVFARCDATGVLMVPRSFHSSQCMVSRIREPRKNAEPPTKDLVGEAVDQEMRE